MSTRCTTHFNHGHKNIAIVYRHSDGYPEVAGKDIERFLKQCSKLEDSRLDDASYLAAKYVVFLADIFNTEYKDGKFKRPKSKLQFRSVRVLKQDTDDIEYRYTIDCDDIVSGLPTVKCEAL